MTLKEIENKIDFFTRAHKALNKKPSSTNDLIFRKYVELESIPKVKKYIQSEGITTPRGTIYQPADISDIIKSTPDDTDKFIVNLAHSIFDKNWKAVDKLYN